MKKRVKGREALSEEEKRKLPREAQEGKRKEKTRCINTFFWDREKKDRKRKLAPHRQLEREKRGAASPRTARKERKDPRMPASEKKTMKIQRSREH